MHTRISAVEAVSWATPERSVFDREGAWIAIAELPARFKPFHIGGDFLLGVIRDELEVERVELYQLSKPGS